MAELQAPDLRIGNKLLRKYWNPQPGNEHYAWEECEVVLIRPDSINIKLRGGAIIGKVPFENVKPMPITAERLRLSLGFEETYNSKYNQHFDHPSNGRIGFKFNKVENTACARWGGDLIPIASVHKLQNLVYALTGTELTA